MGFLGDIAGAIGTGGLSVIPGIAGDTGMDILTGGAVSNAKSVEATNAANFAESQKNRDFQERLSSSAYQRAVEDMRKAGLNPALAYSQGGASTPSGSTATATAPRKGDIGAGLLNTAKTIASEGASLQQVGSQTELNKSQTAVADITAEKLGANAKEAELNQELIRENTKKAKEEAERARMAKQVDKANLPAKKAQAVANERTSKADAFMAYPDALLDRIKSWIPFTKSNAKSYNNTYNYPINQKD